MKGERKMAVDELIHLAKNGDRQALSELIDTHILTVERFAYQIGVSANDVEDVTQEVFIRVYRFLEQYSGKTFTTWLYKITLNVARDHFKKAKRYQTKENMLSQHQEVTEIHVEPTIFMKEEDELLHKMIQQLDEKYKVPLILFYFHDKKIEDIAIILSLPVSTVKTRLSRARAKLKKELEVMGGETNAAR